MKPSLAVLVFLFGFALPAAALHDGPHEAGPGDRVFKVGKKSEVNISKDVSIGDVLVKKGKYLLAHRVEGDRHIVVLTGIDGKKGTSEASVHEIRMRLIPSRDPAKRSELFAKEQSDRSYRIAMIQIAGENGEHVPDTVEAAKAISKRLK